MRVNRLQRKTVQQNHLAGGASQQTAKRARLAGAVNCGVVRSVKARGLPTEGNFLAIALTGSLTRAESGKGITGAIAWI